MDERCNAQDDEPLNDAVEQQNLPLDTRPAVDRPNNQSLKPGAVPIGKLSVLMAMVALMIALFIGILLGGGVPDEVVRNNTVLQAQIKQMSLALEKQGNQINELADTINRVFNTTQDTAVRVNDIYSNTDAKNTGNIKQILRKTDEVVRNNTLMQAQIKQMSLAIEKQGNQIDELASTTKRVFSTTQDTAVRVNDIYSNTDAKNTGNIKQILKTTADSANTLMKLAQSSSKIEGVGTSTGAAVKNVLAVANNLLKTQSQSTLFVSLQSVSCKNIKAAHPSSPTGYYYPNGRMVYCNMGKLCGSSGGWTRLAHLDMSDVTQSCPSGFRLYQFANRRVCGRPNSNGGSCASVKFPTNGISYSQVCGRVVGHARATPDALHNSNPQRNNLNSFYVDGVSITRGSPRKHVWTFVASGATKITHGGAYNCPCSPGSVQKVPSFIGNNYYCEGGAGDPLWDGRDCVAIEKACCSSPNLPWFHRQYNAPTTDYMELRVCANQNTNDEDVPISFYDIYIQ